jgi:hypothetical protein
VVVCAYANPILMRLRSAKADFLRIRKGEMRPFRSTQFRFGVTL